jgi:membrane-bound lytic murein transglycosylase
MFKKPFEEAINTKTLLEIEEADAVKKTEYYRVYPIKQEVLLEEGWENESQKSGVRSQESEVRSQKSEVRRVKNSLKENFNQVNMWATSGVANTFVHRMYSLPYLRRQRDTDFLNMRGRV